MKSSVLTPLERQLAADIAERAASRPDVRRVWIFGSRARGASTEYSDLDVAIEFSEPESADLRRWLERIRAAAEAPVAEQWPGLINLVGLFPEDGDPRLRNRILAEGLIVWDRESATEGLTANANVRLI
jgi:predicted nucleotidyltransferase